MAQTFQGVFGISLVSWRQGFITITKKPTSHPKTQKTKKNPPEKNSLYFWKQNFLVEILKNSYILSKESISYIFEQGSLHFLAQALRFFIF